MHNKMVTLCDLSIAEAKRKANFSAWVRTQLLTQGRPTIDELDQRQMLAIVLTRHQEVHGYEHPVCQQIVDLMQLV